MPSATPIARRLSRVGLRLLAAAAVCLASPVHATAPRGAQVAVLDVGVPQGFDDMARPQRAVADIIFGGRHLGQAEVQTEPGKLAFVDLDAALDLIPDLGDRDAVRAALGAGKLDTHAGLACSTASTPDSCDRSSPAVAGIIFDQDRFRLNLFVNPRFLKVRSATEQVFLPRPDASLSLVDSVAGTIAGGSGSSTDFAIQNRAVIGNRDARIVSTASYASRAGLVADVLAAQIDKPGLRYTAGMYWAPDVDLIGRRKVIGAGVETQFDTRLDKDIVRGSPMIVSLAQRSRVDLLVNGRLVSSRTYEAGNQSLDTSALAEGSYEVVLHVQEIGGASRDERRFFSKNARIAPLGQTIWFVHGGVLANEQHDAFVAPTKHTYFEGGVARRLNPHWAIDGTLVATAGKAIAEIGGYLLLPSAQLRVGVLGSTRQDAGVLIQLDSQGASAFHYTIDARRIHSHDNRPLVPTGDVVRYQTAAMNAGFRHGEAAAGTFTQVVADISYHLPRAQFSLNGFYRKDAGGPANYAVGPTVRWSLLRRNGVDVTLDANLSQSNRGRSAFVGLWLQLLRPRSSLHAVAGAQSVRSESDGRRSSVVGSIGGSWQREDVLGGDLTVSGDLQHTPDDDLLHARADMRGPLGIVAADAVRKLGGGGGGQYGLGFQTTAIVTPTMIALGRRDQSDSVIAVEVRDAPAKSRFEVIVNDTPRGIVAGGDTLPVGVIPYRQYAVRIRPLQGDLVHFDSGTRQVSLYPGNVARLRWAVRPVIAMFGRVVFPDGSAVADADVTAADGIGHTDMNGYFQIETGPEANLTVRAANGKTCRLALHGARKLEGYVSLGTLVCRTEPVPGRVLLTAAK